MIGRHRLHRLRLWLQASVAATIIAGALLIGLVQLALPWVEAHPQKIAAWLSERLQRVVQLDRVEGRWEPDGPELILYGVHIDIGGSEGVSASTIPQAGLKINLFAALHRNLAWNELRLNGLDLHLARGADGVWQMQGLQPRTTNDRVDTQVLFALGSLVLRDLRLTLDDGQHRLLLGGDEVRLINSGKRHRVLARVRCLETDSAPIDAVFEYDEAERSGELYLGGGKLDLVAVLRGYPLAGLRIERGSGQVRVWAWWEQDRLAAAETEVDLHDLVLSTATPIPRVAGSGIVPRIGFERFGFAAGWRRTEAGWHADLVDFSVTRQGESPALTQVHLETSAGSEDRPPRYRLALSNLDLATLASMVMLSDAVPEEWRRWLYEADPIGTLAEASLVYTDAEDFDFRAQLEELAWHAVDKMPGVGGVRGVLRGDAQAMVLRLPGSGPLAIDMPKMFRQPLEFTRLRGDIAAYRGQRGWRLETDALDFEEPAFAGEVRGAIELKDDGGRPLVDLAAVVTQGKVPAARRFWPVNVIPPPAVTWLDHALADGQVLGGRLVMRGDLTDWPFTNLTGRFEAQAEVDDARLVYLPDWPAVEHLRCTADFVDNRLHLEAGAGETLGVRLARASADIADLAEPVLVLDASGSGAGQDLLAFVKATPIGKRFAAELAGVGIGGTGQVRLHLNLPIKAVEQLELLGGVELKDAEVSDAKYGLRLGKARGSLRFDQRGLITESLDGTLNGKAATFSLALGGLTRDPSHAVEARLTATLPARDLLAYAPPLTAYADRVTGEAAWNIAFSADSDTVATPTQRLSVESDLRGVALDLPVPLAKTASEALPLSLVLSPPATGGTLELRLAKLLQLRGHLPSPQQPFAARIEFGGEVPNLLPAEGIQIGGTVPRLDLSGWLDLASGGKTRGSSITGIELKTASLLAWQRDLGAATFGLKPTSDGIDLTFTGANVEGQITVPTELRRRGIIAYLARLNWPEAAESETAVVHANPADLPPLHVRIDDFHLGRSAFGASVLETYPSANGTHFEQVSTHSDNLDLRARGDWLGHAGDDRSSFTIDLSAHDLGRMLDAFGYAGVVVGGETVAHIEGSWPGAPYAFALERLDGSLKATVRAGRIPKADPGAGRVFGLFNLSSLPRRLALDFGDFFESGLSFDSIEGSFSLQAGNAYTHDLRLKGPAADIMVEGRTGLRARDYGQTMLVNPHVGGTLMLGGALLGGPIGAAAGAVLQGVFKDQIAAAVRARYSITGSWEKPVITLLAKERVALPPSAPAGGLPGAGL
jgi:uncharacterized protein (TIGR02099 family)